MALLLRRLPVLVPSGMVSSLPWTSGSEPGVFRDMAKALAQMTRTPGLVQGKGPSSEDGPEDVLSIVAVHIS